MRLCRIGPKGKEKTAIIAADGTYRDLSGHVPLLAGEAVSLKSLDKIRKLRPERLDIIDPVKRYGSCLATVPNFFIMLPLSPRIIPFWVSRCTIISALIFVRVVFSLYSCTTTAV